LRFCTKKTRYGCGAGIGSSAPFIVIFYSLRRTETPDRACTPAYRQGHFDDIPSLLRVYSYCDTYNQQCNGHKL